MTVPLFARKTAQYENLHMMRCMALEAFTDLVMEVLCQSPTLLTDYLMEVIFPVCIRMLFIYEITAADCVSYWAKINKITNV